MTKVRDLVKETSIVKSSGFDDLQPEITVILPTYRRGDNGLFEKCVCSILRQTFKNFELIIVDDASTDSTASVIKKYMQIDNRIMWLRHSKNIGLPAVSEFEGYLQARGNFFFWAFDDNEFIPTAMSKLYEYEKNHPLSVAVFGKARYFYEGKEYCYGNEDFSYSKLWDNNYIPNAPMLMKRFLFNEFGLYDPHIAMTRICDWDLWLRISRKYSFDRLDEILSEEKGPNQPDSLGNSYACDLNLVREWISINRNDLLKPDKFLDYEVDNIPEFLSKASQKTFIQLYKKKYNNFYWSNSNISESSGEPYIMVYVPFKDACIDFYFRGMSDYTQNRIIFFSNDSLKLHKFYTLLANATAIVFARNVDRLVLELMNICLKCKIPYYYYTDDNLFDLGIYEYSSKINKIFRKSSGIIVSNPHLQLFFENKGLNLKYYQVVPVLPQDIKGNFCNDLSKYSHANVVNILYASNSREESFFEMLPLLKKLHDNYKIRLIIFQRNDSRIYDKIKQYCCQNNITTEVLKPEHSIGAFITLLQRKNIHFIIHPECNSVNAKNKSWAFLLVAYMASSILITPRKEQFIILQQNKYLKDTLYSSMDECFDFITHILKDTNYLKKVWSDMAEFCKIHFDPNINECVINQILKQSNVNRYPNENIWRDFVESKGKYHSLFKCIYSKKKHNNKRTITLLSFIKINYKKK